MKITMTVTVDPMKIAPKDVMAALATCGLTEADVKLANTRERTAKPKVAKS